ncbi:MAG: hypothetical protein ABFD66_01520 [Smithella sp.]
MITNKRKIIVSLVPIMILALTSLAFGEKIDVSSGLTGTRDALGTGIQDILKGIAFFAGIVGVGALMFCGFKFMTATDDRDRFQAKAHAFWILGGIALISLSAMIVGYITSLIK